MNKYKDKPRQTASGTPGRGRPRYKIYDVHVHTDVHIGTQMYTWIDAYEYIHKNTHMFMYIYRYERYTKII